MPLVSKNFSDIITFTRASSATYFDSAGVLQSAAIDTPRLDYDPATLAARGLLVEEQRQNIVLYSKDFGATGWATNNVANVTITAAAATSPDGNTNAGSLACASTATAARRMYPAANITVTASTTYTTSFYLKSNTWQWVNLAFTASTGLSEGFTATFDILNGVKGATTQSLGTGVYISHNIEKAGNGWFRILVTGTTGSTLTYRPKIELLDSDTTAGSGCVGVIGNGVYVFGAQLETGAFPTSYIPTTTTALTRSADSAVIGTLTPWYNVATGTLYGEFNGVASGTRTVEDINDGTSNESIRLRTVSTDPKFTVTDGGVDQADIDAGTVASNTTYKFAGAYAANDFAACINGGTVQTDTSGTIPTVTQMVLGKSAASNYLNGYLRRVTYYPRRLSDAELQTITA